MLCWLQVFSREIQLCIHVYLFFSRFFSLIGYFKIMSIAQCAIQWVLVGYLFYLWECVYINPKLLIYPYPQASFW